MPRVNGSPRYSTFSSHASSRGCSGSDRAQPPANVEAMAQEMGITMPQRLVLRVVGQFPDLSAAGDLAHILRLHPSTITGISARRARGYLSGSAIWRHCSRRARLRLKPSADAASRAAPERSNVPLPPRSPAWEAQRSRRAEGSCGNCPRARSRLTDHPIRIQRRMTTTMLSRLISLLMCACFALASPALAQNDPDWTRPFPPFRHYRERLLGGLVRPGDLSDHHTAGKHPDQHRRRRHGEADQGERGATRVQAGGHEDPDGDARALRPRRRHGGVEAHDRREAHGVGARQGAVRIGRQAGLPVRRHAVRAGSSPSTVDQHVQGQRHDRARRDRAHRAPSTPGTPRARRASR